MKYLEHYFVYLWEIQILVYVKFCVYLLNQQFLGFLLADERREQLVYGCFPIRENCAYRVI